MIRVAIIDDEVEVRENFAAMVGSTKEFICAATYPSCEAALPHLPLILPDIVLLDITIPNHISGIEGIGRIKALLPEVHVIMITVQQDPESVFASLQAGACGYLVKEVSTEALVRALHEINEGGAPMSMSIARMVVEHFQNRPPVPALSERQKQILNKLCEGKSNKAIANELFITVATVKFHIHKIYEALHVSSKAEAIVKIRSR